MSKKILVAEDSSVIQNLTKKILSLQNYQISVVKNGEQVLEKLHSENFDLILLDIFMPKMDGMECARQIRQLSDNSNSGIPLIAISGNANNYTLEDFKAVGFNDYLPKPLNYDSLVEMVNNYLNHGN